MGVLRGASVNAATAEAESNTEGSWPHVPGEGPNAYDEKGHGPAKATAGNNKQYHWDIYMHHI